MGSVCGASSASVQSAQGIAVLRRAMDLQKQEGQAVVQMLQTAGQVQQQAAPEPGKGSAVDVTA